jgi:hypothetical protein
LELSGLFYEYREHYLHTVWRTGGINGTKEGMLWLRICNDAGLSAVDLCAGKGAGCSIQLPDERLSCDGGGGNV